MFVFKHCFELLPHNWIGRDVHRHTLRIVVITAGDDKVKDIVRGATVVGTGTTALTVVHARTIQQGLLRFGSTLVIACRVKRGTRVDALHHLRMDFIGASLVLVDMGRLARIAVLGCVLTWTSIETCR